MTRHRVLLAIPAALLTLALAACSTDPAPSEQGAAVMCEEFVRERLHSPGSADFSGVLDTGITTLAEDPWQYQVDGHVDSDNAFGAQLRNTYTCTISTTDGDTWTLDDLEMTEN